MTFVNVKQLVPFYKIIDEANLSLANSPRSATILDDSDRTRDGSNKYVQLQIPDTKILILRRSEDGHIYTDPTPPTPSNGYATKPPFSVINKPQVYLREPFSPQYHIQPMYRSISLDTPAPHNDVIDVLEVNSFFEDVPPLQFFDKPPKLPRRSK